MVYCLAIHTLGKTEFFEAGVANQESRRRAAAPYLRRGFILAGRREVQIEMIN